MMGPVSTNPNIQATGPASVPLRRPYGGRLVAGVAAGIAEYLSLDVSVVRIAFVLLTLLGGLGIPAYLAAWILMPDEGAAESVAEEWMHRYQSRAA